MCVGVMCVRVYIHALVNCTCHTAYPRHTNGQKAHVLEGRRLLTTNLGHYRENQTLSWRVATQEVFFCREILFIESDKDDNDDDDDEAGDRDDFFLKRMKQMMATMALKMTVCDK